MNIEKTYNTKQRDIVLGLFRENPETCFSAKDVIDNPIIDVGEATVFRCLAKLTSEGKLKKYIGADGSGALYQYQQEACNSHFHLKCVQCGEVIHMDCDVMHEMQKHIEGEHDFIVDPSKTVLYGLCKKCSQNKTEVSQTQK